jgi:hypothetical protein
MTGRRYLLPLTVIRLGFIKSKKSQLRKELWTHVTVSLDLEPTDCGTGKVRKVPFTLLPSHFFPI